MKKYSYRILLFLTMLLPAVLFAQDSLYKLGPLSKPQNGVPKGVVTKYAWQSRLFNNFRDYYIYVPAQYDPSKPAALMVFQDGFTYVKEDGDFRVPTVFDNLIQQKLMPVTIGLFINPGHLNTQYPESLFSSSNRSAEYDDMSDKYVAFLIDELIPELKKQYNISDDSRMHAISGLSSGGICAFTAAWQRPDYFQKVMSHVGSFTNIRGGHIYPDLVRRTTKKNIKVFIQSGTGDLNNNFGDWWLSNQQMASAFKFRGYDYQFVGGKGGHGGKHGGSILPETLQWLWSDVMISK